MSFPAEITWNSDTAAHLPRRAGFGGTPGGRMHMTGVTPFCLRPGGIKTFHFPVPGLSLALRTGEAREKFSPSLFTDPNLDEPPVDIADKTTPAGPLEIDVTEAVRKAYAEADDAAVLFRFDVATDGFDLSDQFSNAYVLAGPGIGKLSDKHRAPALEVFFCAMSSLSAAARTVVYVR